MGKSWSKNSCPDNKQICPQHLPFKVPDWAVSEYANGILNFYLFHISKSNPHENMKLIIDNWIRKLQLHAVVPVELIDITLNYAKMFHLVSKLPHDHVEVLLKRQKYCRNRPREYTAAVFFVF